MTWLLKAIDNEDKEKDKGERTKKHLQSSVLNYDLFLLDL